MSDEIDARLASLRERTERLAAPPALAARLALGVATRRAQPTLEGSIVRLARPFAAAFAAAAAIALALAFTDTVDDELALAADVELAP